MDPTKKKKLPPSLKFQTNKEEDKELDKANKNPTIVDALDVKILSQLKTMGEENKTQFYEDQLQK